MSPVSAIYDQPVRKNQQTTSLNNQTMTTVSSKWGTSMPAQSTVFSRLTKSCADLTKWNPSKLSLNYNTDKAKTAFCESIANTTRSGVLLKIKNYSFCSLSCNGSTDFTREDMLAVYIRTCTNGKIEDLFLHLGTSESSPVKIYTNT